MLSGPRISLFMINSFHSAILRRRDIPLSLEFRLSRWGDISSFLIAYKLVSAKYLYIYIYIFVNVLLKFKSFSV